MKNKYPIIYILLPVLILIYTWNVFGQTSDRNQKSINTIAQLQKSIDQTTQLLSGSTEEKKELLKKLDLLQSQISYRKELKEKLGVELKNIESQTLLLKSQHNSSYSQLKSRRKEYAHLLKNKLIHRLTYNPILAFINPVNLDDNVKHWYLMDRMEIQRQQTLKNLLQSSHQYTHTLQKLTIEMTLHDSLLKSVQNEEIKFEEDIVNSNALIKDLSSKESGLNAELMDYKKKKEQLKLLIESSITNLTKSKSTTSSKNKLSIKYPFRDPTITSRFGKNMDDGKSKLLIRNNGIDLQSKDPFVRVSVNSEVVEIRKMPNQLYLVITKTDDVFIVYSNLENVLLKNGEKVEQGVNLGKASKNQEGFYELHFETWIEKTPIDPLLFLQKN